MLLIGCSEGGTSIEDLAEKYPEKIVRIPVDIREGITNAQARLSGFPNDTLVDQQCDTRILKKSNAALGRAGTRSGTDTWCDI